MVSLLPLAAVLLMQFMSRGHASSEAGTTLDPGTTEVDPLKSSSSQAEALLNLLVLQRNKVELQIEKAKLEKQELAKDAEMHELMANITGDQLQKLKAGQRASTLSLTGGFAKAMEALRLAASKSTSSEEETGVEH
mmetsp:Transcript_12913/g.30215  ORF Transcript_12913/g.30215 Transcript_12913/m.30215 type:complete len:136 (+) Transcript_12913:61-468(+)